MNYIYKYKSPIGLLIFESDGESLAAVWIDGRKNFANKLEGVNSETDLPVFSETKRWFDLYFSGQIPTFTPLLAPQGGEFRQAVWEILSAIPYGKTISYGDIARQIAKQMGKEKMSAQAVGGAVGQNPISIIIPCHRVIGTNGNLTGYASGLDVKIKLLAIEGVEGCK